MAYSVLIDPALKNNSGEPSDNLGDLIISEDIRRILADLFPKENFIPVSPHLPFASKEKQIINSANFVFVGGSNILTSDIRHFPRLSPEKIKGFYLFPGFKNLVLIGTGWNRYDTKPDWATRIFYRKILHRKLLHSLRDQYSANHLQSARIANLLFTGCPTTWNLDPYFRNSFEAKHPILCTLTDYNRNVDQDNQLLYNVVEYSNSITYFYPQGSEDISYLQSLTFYQNNKSKFKSLPRCYNHFKDIISDGRLNYIGTRLHAGIKCLQHKIPSLIIGIDNRAWEMGQDLSLPVVARNETSIIGHWVEKKRATSTIKLPYENIKKWKDQFQSL